MTTPPITRDAYYIHSILRKKKMPGKIPTQGRPRLLDLCCGAGGATRGYQISGFHVTGIDNKMQPHYVGHDFIVADIIQYLTNNLDYIKNTYHVVHASPPCQYWCEGSNRDQHRDLITPIRPLLQELNLPYIIENVKHTPLYPPPNLTTPTKLNDYRPKPLELCGSMFGLGTYRDRWFETNFPVIQPPHPRHVAPDEMMILTGRFADPEKGAWAMCINWMTRDELREAIPPAYTSYIGAHALQIVDSVAT